MDLFPSSEVFSKSMFEDMFFSAPLQTMGYPVLIESPLAIATFTKWTGQEPVLLWLVLLRD